MTLPELDAWLGRSLEDRRFSRGERQALAEILAKIEPAIDRDEVRRRAFQIARAELNQPDIDPVLGWLEDLTRALREVTPPPQLVRSEAYFSPGDDCLRAIQRLLDEARHALDICVFTITDDRLADAILGAHARKVAIRIITDDAKAEDLGSDVARFEQAGIATRVDRSPYHMHHKFAIIDRETLLTGSYNWTRGAAKDNEENLIVTNDPRFLVPFGATFDRLWSKLG